MGGIRRTVGVDGIVGIAVVGNDDSLITVRLCGLNHVMHTCIDSHNGLLYSLIHTGMTHHVTIGKVHHNEIILVGADGLHQTVAYKVGAHLGLQVVCGHLGRRHQDTVLALERKLAPAVQEECHVCVFLSLGYMELLQTLGRDILAKGIVHVLLVKQDVHSRERSVIRGQAVVLQAGNGVHPLSIHVLLGEDYGQLLGTVITEVEEDNGIALLYTAVIRLVHDRLHELVGHALGVGFLHSLDHVGGFASLTAHKLVVRYLDTLPALVTVHCIVAAYYGGHLVTALHELVNESLAALGVGVTAIHETVNVCLVNAVLACNVGQAEQMLQ